MGTAACCDFLIWLYQKIVSPILRHWLKCRFYPSCSEYASLAIKKHGFLKGIRKIYNRLLKCRPDNFDSCIDFP
jgi:putative membrane protein insertion efficiency factor